MSTATDSYVPTYEVQIGGRSYQEAFGRIADLVVETTTDGADRFSITLTELFDLETREFADVNWERLRAESDVEIAMGWGGQNEPVFRGTSQSVTVDYSADNGPSVTLAGYGPLHQLMKGVKDRSWKEVKVSDVVRDVLDGNGLSTGNVDSSSVDRERLIQHGQNDYQFVRGLADTYGYEFYSHLDDVFFTRRSSREGEDPVATLRYGVDLETFTVESNAAVRVGNVEVRYWDASQTTEVVGKASNGNGGSGKDVYRITCDSQAEADRIAESKLRELNEAVVTGHGEVRGVPALTAGAIVELGDLGSEFSKNYYITRASHRMGGRGYHTSFEVKEI